MIVIYLRNLVSLKDQVIVLFSVLTGIARRIHYYLKDDYLWELTDNRH